MIKRLVVGLLLLIVLGLVGLNSIGITPAFIVYGPGVASGIGAKLLCSAEYVIGSERDQAFEDLVQYSPILSQITIRYDETKRAVTSSLFGMKEKTASFIPGLGCAVDYANYPQRSRLTVQQDEASAAPWPAGSGVSSIDLELQTLLETLLEQDNSRRLNTRALLLVHEGMIKAEAYGQSMTSESRLLGWSMAKSLNAIMLGNLEMRGFLSLYEVPGFPQWSADSRSAITSTDLLTMTWTFLKTTTRVTIRRLCYLPAHLHRIMCWHDLWRRTPALDSTIVRAPQTCSRDCIRIPSVAHKPRMTTTASRYSNPWVSSMLRSRQTRAEFSWAALIFMLRRGTGPAWVS